MDVELHGLPEFRQVVESTQWDLDMIPDPMDI
jgi:hypothetical protein